MRILGRALVAVGVLVSVYGVLTLTSLVHVGENRPPRSRGDAFGIGLWQTALVATPGILIALAGWALSRRDQAATGRMVRSPVPWWTWVPVVVVAWVGAALYISSVTATPHVPAASAGVKDLNLADHRADQPAVDPAASADRAAHPIPAVGLRRAERKLEARLHENYPGSVVDVACVRSHQWHVSCHVELTNSYGSPSSFSVQGRYLRQTRTVRFDTP